MSFRIGVSQKPARPPPPKGKGGISLGGISFKQLEEDEEEEEDLSVYTGKYDKILDGTQKSSKSLRENRLSTSSTSSASSVTDDVKVVEKCKPDPSIKKYDSDTTHPRLSSVESDSPLKKSARAKLESSKELFSGLKGKISDKISKTIEEFSNDSNSSPSPENEKLKDSPIQVANEKEIPFHGSKSIEPILKEVVTPLQAAPPLSESNHPLAVSNDSENEECEEDTTVTEASPKDEEEGGATFYDPRDKEENSDDEDDPMDIFVNEEHFKSDPLEDIMSGSSGLTTSTKLKSRSKIKKLIPKKSSKTSAVASLSGLAELSSETKPVSSPAVTGDYSAIIKTIESTEKSEARIKNDKNQVRSSKSDSSSEESPKSRSINYLRQLSTDYAPIPYSRVTAVVIALFAYMIIPMPSFLSGLIFGMLLASAGWIFYVWLIEPPHPSEPLTLPPLEDVPPPVPEMKQTVPSSENVYKGWMNELTDYNVDEYHINKSHSIFVSLEGTHLRLQRPKNPAPKRAMWDESLTKPQFIHQRHFDLPGSKVFLSPSGLVKKRIWSKKYPIVISLGKIQNSKSTGKEITPGLKHTSSETSLEEKQKADRLHEMGFEVLTEDSCNSNILYLFARTGREKEEWFKRLSAAASGKPLGNHIVEMRQVVKESMASFSARMDNGNRLQRESSTDSVGSVSSQADGHTETIASEGSELLSFSQYMGRLMPASSTSSSRASSPSHLTSIANKDSLSSSFKQPGSLENKEKEEGASVTPKVLTQSAPIICDNQLFWLNALIGRCFFDFLRDKWWIGKVTEKLQKKLSKIHVPYFIEELQVSSIEMGYEIPTIRHAGKPYMDERGFWVDLDITYSGGFKMTIETKMNLMKLKKTPHSSRSSDTSVDRIKSPITDSEEEDSAESSTDEEEEVVTDENNVSGGGTSKKFMRYLNKITQSRYFQQATEYKVVKRAMENVSNTPLTLTVTVNSLVGKLAINIPPPPSDRLWYGFRGNPRLRLSAKPQVGERAVTFTHITDWIEKKLAIEFQRVFVMPNMDDLVIPILVPGEVNGTAMTHSMSL